MSRLLVTHLSCAAACAAVIDHLGTCRDPADCPWDFDGDGVVGILDMLELLAHLGPCP